MSFPEFPAQLGYPSIFTDHWDPFLAACEETGTVVCLHTGASAWAPLPSPGPPFALLPTVFPVNALLAAGEWLWSGVPAALPALDVALSEGGIGWVPMLMDRVDYVLDHSASGTEGAAWDSDLRPSEVLGRNFWFCTIDDPSMVPLLDRIGIDHVMVECDYPHADSTWPDTQAVVSRAFGGLPRPTGLPPTGVPGFFGSTGSAVLQRPVVGMAATPDGRGYWLVASDGGIFSFGDARYFGSTGALRLDAPDRRHGGHPRRSGLLARGVRRRRLHIRRRRFFGSLGGKTSTAPVIGMAAAPDGRGYWLGERSDGGVFAFGKAALPRIHGRPTARPTDRRGSRPRPQVAATGSPPPIKLHQRIRVVARDATCRRSRGAALVGLCILR